MSEEGEPAKTPDYQKITLRGTISERPVFHRRLYQSESFTTFKVRVKVGQTTTVFPIIAYGHSAVTAGRLFRVDLRIMIVGEIKLDSSGRAKILVKFWRYGRMADGK